MKLLVTRAAENYHPDLSQRRSLYRHCALHCALQKLSQQTIKVGGKVDERNNHNLV